MQHDVCLFDVCEHGDCKIVAENYVRETGQLGLNVIIDGQIYKMRSR